MSHKAFWNFRVLTIVCGFVTTLSGQSWASFEASEGVKNPPATNPACSSALTKEAQLLHSMWMKSRRHDFNKDEVMAILQALNIDSKLRETTTAAIERGLKQTSATSLFLSRIGTQLARMSSSLNDPNQTPAVETELRKAQARLANGQPPETSKFPEFFYPGGKKLSEYHDKAFATEVKSGVTYHVTLKRAEMAEIVELLDVPPETKTKLTEALEKGLRGFVAQKPEDWKTRSGAHYLEVQTFLGVICGSENIPKNMTFVDRYILSQLDAIANQDHLTSPIIIKESSVN